MVMDAILFFAGNAINRVDASSVVQKAEFMVIYSRILGYEAFEVELVCWECFFVGVD